MLISTPLKIAIWFLCRAWNSSPRNEDDLGEIAWDYAITAKEARKKLELKFYRFAEIDWLPIDEAIVQAEVTHRPIHAILLWGALDDESC